MQDKKERQAVDRKARLKREKLAYILFSNVALVNETWHNSVLWHLINPQSDPIFLRAILSDLPDNTECLDSITRHFPNHTLLRFILGLL